MLDEFVDDFMSDFDERFVSGLIDDLAQLAVDHIVENYMLMKLDMGMFGVENNAQDEITLSFEPPDLQYKSEINHY